MTKDETLALMGIIQTAYPQFYRGMKKEQAENTVNLWATMFADDCIEVVRAAVESFIVTDTKGFPPTIGIIKDYVIKVTSPPVKSELEAWAEVKKALARSGYNSKEEFAKLDDDIQRVVGSPNQLREWAMVEIPTLDSVIASNFQRSYRAVAKANREYRALPSAVTDIVNALSQKMTISTNPQKALPSDKELEKRKEAILKELTTQKA